MIAKIIGINLIIIGMGLIMLGYTGFKCVTTESIVDYGNIAISQETTCSQWLPMLGVVLLVCGIVFIVRTKKPVTDV